MNSKWSSNVHFNFSFSQVHDYHLMLFPKYFREKRPTAAVSFFLHIPFPSSGNNKKTTSLLRHTQTQANKSDLLIHFLWIPVFGYSEVYKVLPVRAELLIALLHCNLIGFHTNDYARHFLLACSYLLGIETAPKGVYYRNEFVSVGAFSVGIDVQKWQEILASTEVQQRVQQKNYLNSLTNDPISQILIDSFISIIQIRQLEETFSGKKVFLGVDRLDYIKGLPHKFQAFELFLKQHPEYQVLGCSMTFTKARNTLTLSIFLF